MSSHAVPRLAACRQRSVRALHSPSVRSRCPPGSSVRVEAGAMRDDARRRGDDHVHARILKGCGAHWAVKASSSTTSPHRRAASSR